MAANRDTRGDSGPEVRDLLAEVGLTSFVKTSGSKGFHIAVPLDGKSDFGAVARFAHVVGKVMVQRDPDNLTQEFHKVDRGSRILVDTGRNGYSATYAATYTVRAKPGAPVSAPCTWAEVAKGKVDPQSFNVRNMRARVATVGDLWSSLHDTPQSLTPILKKLRDKA